MQDKAALFGPCIVDSNLTILDISHNEIGRCDVQPLAPYIAASKLTTLNISHNAIGGGAAETLGPHIAASKLTTLDISNNAIGSGVVPLAPAIAASRLTTLDISNNEISAYAATLFIHQVAYNAPDLTRVFGLQDQFNQVKTELRAETLESLKPPLHIAVTNIILEYLGYTIDTSLSPLQRSDMPRDAATESKEEAKLPSLPATAIDAAASESSSATTAEPLPSSSSSPSPSPASLVPTPNLLPAAHPLFPTYQEDEEEAVDPLGNEAELYID